MSNKKETNILLGKSDLPQRIRARNKSQKFTTAFTWSMMYSDAYRDLKPSARDILHYGIMQLMQGKKKSNVKYTNSDKILLEYAEIQRLFKVSKMTVWRSISSLLEHGFFKVMHYGGGDGNASIYGYTRDWMGWKQGDVVRVLLKKNRSFKTV